MTTKNSLLTYHDGKLAQIAAIYGDYLESLCLIEKFSILTDIAAWGDQCCVYNEDDWSSFGGFMAEHGETSEDYDAHGLLTHADCDWTNPVHSIRWSLRSAIKLLKGFIYQRARNESRTPQR